MSSSSTLQAKVAADRRALQAALSEVRERLSPSAITNEVGHTLTSRVSAAGQTIGEKASSPAGLIALCSMAFATAFAFGGGMKRKPADATPRLPEAVGLAQAKLPTRDTLAMLLQLSAAVATGAVASRYLPVTQAERDLLAGVGPELKGALQRQIEEQAQRLVAPRSDRFGLLNLLALGGALLLSRKR